MKLPGENWHKTFTFLRFLWNEKKLEKWSSAPDQHFNSMSMLSLDTKKKSTFLISPDKCISNTWSLYDVIFSSNLLIVLLRRVGSPVLLWSVGPYTVNGIQWRKNLIHAYTCTHVKYLRIYVGALSFINVCQGYRKDSKSWEVRRGGIMNQVSVLAFSIKLREDKQFLPLTQLWIVP